MSGTMYEYYGQQQVLPTHAAFRTPEQLDAYERLRRNTFVHKLSLPPHVFRDASLLEFGPDSGENSLVFARWGANCTLSEPNPRARPFISEYFRRFDLSAKLTEIRDASVTEFDARYPDEKYDLIDAEGFIYTVRPEEQWMTLFARLLNKQGFAIISYLEAYGCFLEFFLKVIHSRVKELTGLGSLEVAEKVFHAKWNSIPHTRSLASWVMDVMDNPFVRLKYVFESQDFCRSMHKAGLSLYSSWPSYKDGMNVDWVKKPWTNDGALEAQMRFLSQSRLSHLFGQKCFLNAPDKELEGQLWDALTMMDGLIDEFKPDRSARCRACLDSVAGVVSSDRVLTDASGSADLLGCLKSIQNVLLLLEVGNVDDIVRFTNADESFIRHWGSPGHYAVFCHSDYASMGRRQ